MNADLQGVLNNISRAYRVFEHNDGSRMTKQEVIELMKYGLAKGYKTTNEISEQEENLLFGKPKRSN